MSRIVHVAVGVIFNQSGEILIAKRPDKVHQGGLWEFPGGKVEEGESLFKALKRELFEELAIEIQSTEPLIQIRHDYGDKVVFLDVHKVTGFIGNACGNEGQPIQWVAPADLYNYEFPAANRPIVAAINLPQRLLITGAANSSEDLLSKAEKALLSGHRLLQLRLHAQNFNAQIAQDFARLCSRYKAKVLLNTSPEMFKSLVGLPRGTGLHLNSEALMAVSKRPVADSVLLSASCHNETEIKQARMIGVDFICLSPVLKTKSHPDATPLGWQEFSRLVEFATVPVFALGGMSESALPDALQAGAQGIAAISEWWD